MQRRTAQQRAGYVWTGAVCIADSIETCACLASGPAAVCRCLCFISASNSSSLNTSSMSSSSSTTTATSCYSKTGTDSPYSFAEHRVPELIPVLDSQPAGDVSHKPGGRVPLLSARTAVTLATLNRAATNFAAWWTDARWVSTVSLRLLLDSVATAIWTQALLRLSPAL